MSGTIVCAFPATGKTTAINNAAKLNISACDSDSEDHHWVDRSLPREERVEREDWVNRYVTHLLAETSVRDIVFCSTHQEVRDALVARGVPFVVVYPTEDQKGEYLERVANRTTGLHGEFGLNLITKMWDIWIAGMREQTQCRHVVLQRGEYLANRLGDIRAA